MAAPSAIPTAIRPNLPDTESTPFTRADAIVRPAMDAVKRSDSCLGSDAAIFPPRRASA